MYSNYPVFDAANPATVTYDDALLELSFTSGGFTRVFDSSSSNAYSPVQMFLKAPSEHTVFGQHKDLEMRFSHQDSNGDYGILAILFDMESGVDDNWFLSKL